MALTLLVGQFALALATISLPLSRRIACMVMVQTKAISRVLYSPAREDVASKLEALTTLTVLAAGSPKKEPALVPSMIQTLPV